MPTYAIGDVQGCFDELEQLLRDIGFAREDRLWFVGDLVNRGPKSLEVLRFVKSLGRRAVTVLGNHDLHLIAQHEGFERARPDDTFSAVLAAPDRGELVDWLRSRPLMHVEGDVAMVHAGLLPQWSRARAADLAHEVEAALVGADYREFFAHMYGSRPDRWDEDLRGWDRLRVIVNAMTRLRFCTRDGRMEFHAKGRDAPAGYLPWYETRPAEPGLLVCGHWSALGLKLTPHVALLDSGCVWGGALTALRVEDRRVWQLKCRGYQAAGGQ
jgi:bis(5'-nucleosyl)-tetraphosphatase (symmetrical)